LKAYPDDLVLDRNLRVLIDSLETLAELAEVLLGGPGLEVSLSMNISRLLNEVLTFSSRRPWRP
jgi:hypothetical protein